MAWMARHEGARRDPTRLVPACASVVCVAVRYDGAGDDPDEDARRSGLVARYARARDYHKAMGKSVRRLAAWIEERTGSPARGFVDTAPVLERAFSERAGLGWIGKNACLIHPKFGSWLLLGEVLTAARLEPDDGPHLDHCGSCTACLDVCPTDAIVEPGVVDANACIAHWTIEHRGPIPRERREGNGRWMFGCDLCQTCCPWNREAGIERRARGASGGALWEARAGLDALDPEEMLALDEATFRARYSGTPLMRAKWDGMRRNACVVLGNVGDPSGIPALVGALADADPVVRGHAAWALGRIGGAGAADALRGRGREETEPDVRDEIRDALAAVAGASAERE